MYIKKQKQKINKFCIIEGKQIHQVTSNNLVGTNHNGKRRQLRTTSEREKGAVERQM
jgi:hypothetical protein